MKLDSVFDEQVDIPTLNYSTGRLQPSCAHAWMVEQSAPSFSLADEAPSFTRSRYLETERVFSYRSSPFRDGAASDDQHPRPMASRS